MSNLNRAKTFLQMAGMGEVQAAYDKFISDHFIHHNPYFKGDRESLLRAMEEAHRDNPNKSIEIKRAYESGSTVVTQSLVIKNDISIAVVHIFRFEGEKVVELWDIGNVIDKNSPNGNGYF